MFDPLYLFLISFSFGQIIFLKCRVKEVGKNTCDVTYCVRVKPSGSLPKSVALLVSNELVYTLFNLRQKAESVWSARKAKMRLKKKK